MQEQPAPEIPITRAGMSDPLSSTRSLRYHSDFWLGVRSAHFHSITISPTVLHSDQDETREKDNKQHKAALLGPQVHEERQGQSCFCNSCQQHALKFGRCVGVAECNNELQCREDQKAEIDQQVSSDRVGVPRYWLVLLHIGCIYHNFAPSSLLA